MSVTEPGRFSRDWPPLPTSPEVIEFLTIRLPPGARTAYLERNAGVWTPFLERQDGFVGKETWLPADDPDSVVFVIRWRSRASWKQITPEMCAAVDALMGESAPRSVDCVEYSSLCFDPTG